MTSPNGSNQNPIHAENHRMRNEIMKILAENRKLLEEIQALHAEIDKAIAKEKRELSEVWGEGD